MRVRMVAGCYAISINNVDGGNVGKHDNKQIKNHRREESMIRETVVEYFYGRWNIMKEEIYHSRR